MKRFLILIGALVVLAGAAYYYYTWKISSQIDRMIAQVRPFVEIDYDDVTLGLGGEARINDISIRPRAGGEEITIRRIAFRGANLYELWRLSSQIENGRVPHSMGFAVSGVEIPLDSQIARGMQPGQNVGLIYSAAGCGPRTVFDTRDLTGMDYWDMVFDLDIQYHILDRGTEMSLDLTARTHSMAEMSINAMLDLGTSVSNFRDLAGGPGKVRVDSITVDYVDLGFHSRMLDYCSGETGMSKDAYITHHMEAWQARWRQAGLVPDAETVDAYRQFLTSPDRLEIRLDPSYAARFSQFQGQDPATILRQFNSELSVNNGPSRVITFSPVEPAAVAAGEAAPEEETVAAAEPGPADADAAPRQVDETAEPESEPVSAPETTRPAWQAVSPSRLAEYPDQRVELATREGKSYDGRIDRVEGDRVYIQVRRPGGFYVIPVTIAEIDSARVRRD